jgi:hypothetical protein
MALKISMEEVILKFQRYTVCDVVTTVMGISGIV